MSDVAGKVFDAFAEKGRLTVEYETCVLMERP